MGIVSDSICLAICIVYFCGHQSLVSLAYLIQRGLTGRLVKPYLKGMAKVIKPAPLLDKDPEILSHMMATVLLLVLISVCCMLGELLIFVQFGDIGLMANFF